MVYKEATIDSIRPASFRNQWSVILKSIDADDYFPVYVSIADAEIISDKLIHNQVNEHDNNENLVAGKDVSGYRLESLLIDESKGVIRARLFYEKYDAKMEIECPVAEAIALTVRRNVSIFADERCFNVSIPDPRLQSPVK